MPSISFGTEMGASFLSCVVCVVSPRGFAPSCSSTLFLVRIIISCGCSYLPARSDELMVQAVQESDLQIPFSMQAYSATSSCSRRALSSTVLCRRHCSNYDTRASTLCCWTPSADQKTRRPGRNDQTQPQTVATRSLFPIPLWKNACIISDGRMENTAFPIPMAVLHEKKRE